MKCVASAEDKSRCLRCVRLGLPTCLPITRPHSQVPTTKKLFHSPHSVRVEQKHIPSKEVGDSVTLDKDDLPSQSVSKSCNNCGIDSTIVWHKVDGANICNPCGIYFKANGSHRPPQEKVIIKRSVDPRKRSYSVTTMSSWDSDVSEELSDSRLESPVDVC